MTYAPPQIRSSAHANPVVAWAWRKEHKVTVLMSHPPEFDAFLTCLYDAQANLEAKLRAVKAIRACADRYPHAERDARAMEALCEQFESFNRLNATGSDILKSLNKALRELIIAGPSASSAV